MRRARSVPTRSLLQLAQQKGKRLVFCGKPSPVITLWADKKPSNATFTMLSSKTLEVSPVISPL